MGFFMDSKEVKVLDVFIFEHGYMDKHVTTIITDHPIHKSFKVELCNPFKSNCVMVNGEEMEYKKDSDQPLAIMLRNGMVQMLYDRDCVYMTGISIGRLATGTR